MVWGSPAVLFWQACLKWNWYHLIMLAALETPTWKDFWLLLGRILLYTLPVLFVGNMRPVIAHSFPTLIFSRLKKPAEIFPYRYNTILA